MEKRRERLAAVLVGALVAGGAGAVESRVPRIAFSAANGVGPGSVAVHGLAPARLACLAGSALDRERWEAIFPVRVLWAVGEGEAPAVLGGYRLAEASIVFEPHFPFKPGLELVAAFDGALFDRFTSCAGEEAAATAGVELAFTTPDTATAPSTRVVAVYPTADVVPENLLRIYVHFSAPMRPRGVPAAVRLVEEGSGPVETAFVEVEDGLWDRGRRRLTLFLHPGRIKRGVGPHRELGPPLRAGRRYRLSIGGGLRDAAGQPLAAGFEKIFTAGPADRQAPDPADWRLVAPASPGAELVLELPEPLDRALLLRMVAVVDAAGERVPGLATVATGERRWLFRPVGEWAAGSYRLRVETAIEDLAGNTPAGLFDREADAGSAAAGEADPFIELGFEVP